MHHFVHKASLSVATLRNSAMVRYATSEPSDPDLLMIWTRNNPPLTGAYNGCNNGYNMNGWLIGSMYCEDGLTVQFVTSSPIIGVGPCQIRCNPGFMAMQASVREVILLVKTMINLSAARAMGTGTLLPVMARLEVMPDILGNAVCPLTPLLLNRTVNLDQAAAGRQAVITLDLGPDYGNSPTQLPQAASVKKAQDKRAINGFQMTASQEFASDTRFSAQTRLRQGTIPKRAVGCNFLGQLTMPHVRLRGRGPEQVVPLGNPIRQLLILKELLAM
ncbi:hypothetical protein K443DRAFT_634586 [Laccaria amethystina LaAM-08-1]|uniref:Uncharacterized protein n=1 Tax=Laccaria amethystina LaAM-08-1 TaxID=1095629 RepID=A0A0C9WVR0_9AGAR|nr:hypothetical protein K443DRAFT_634586 [Laccaria amethystina LaAM-08-1]